MTLKQEYSILPHEDRDDFHHHVRNGQRAVTNQYICIFSAVTLGIFLILAGVATLTATIYYSDETFGQFWYKSVTTAQTTPSGDSFRPSAAGSRNENNTTPISSLLNQNSSDYIGRNKTYESNFYHHLHHLNNRSHLTHSNYSISESDLQNLRNGTNNSSLESDEFEFVQMGDGDGAIDLDDLKEKFAETMRNIEKRMETMTGIRRAEFVVPIFMLICFLTFFSLISLCCCVMMRRRDTRRRKLFGKLITDLQTGDSKTVLLNHSDLDD